MPTCENVAVTRILKQNIKRKNQKPLGAISLTTKQKKIIIFYILDY